MMNIFTFELGTIENIYFSGLINEVDEIFNFMSNKIKHGNVVFLVRKLEENHTETVEIFCENAALLSYQNKFMDQHHVSLNKLFEIQTMNLEPIALS